MTLESCEFVERMRINLKFQIFCAKCLICEGKLYFCIPNLHGLGDRFEGEIAI